MAVAQPAETTQAQEKKERFRIGSAFFWIAYAILLFISVPHAA